MAEIEQELLGRVDRTPLTSGRDRTLQDRAGALMGLLGDPQRTFPVIHVTGTNGKTSTTRLAERLLRELGLTTGRFTSPHLHDIRERIALDGESIAADKFISAYSRVLPAAKRVDAQLVAAGEAPLAFFEVLTAVAFVAFAKAGVNAVVVEVGIGGEHDSTNVVNAEVAVVTPVGMDHMPDPGRHTGSHCH